MAGFYYFFPRMVNVVDYLPLGLEYAFDRPPAVTQLAAPNGPAGSSGTVLHDGQAPGLPATLKWYRASDEMWVGFNEHDRPGPERLRRAVEISAGTAVKLADGQFWGVPRVLACTDRDPNRIDGLPRVFCGQAEDGTPEAKLPDAYAPLVQYAEHFLAAFVGEGTGALPSGEALAFASAVLGVGYRVSVAEVLALELLDARCCESICLDAIDAFEHELARSPAAITARFDEAQIGSWSQFTAFRILAEQQAAGEAREV